VSSSLLVATSSSRAGRRALARLVGRSGTVLTESLRERAAKIVRQVERGGDAKLLALSRRLDQSGVTSVAALAQRVVEEQERDLVAAGFPEAVERAIAAVERYHRPQIGTGYSIDEDGIELTEVVEPLRRVGIYVPGGRASYPSTLIMTAVPARLAGVSEIVVVSPPTALRGSAPLRYTLARLGITEIWGLGGAHGIAALAYGTKTIRRVDKIVGPGNAWVTAAKQLVSDRVGIDGLAGPSELVVIASAPADAAMVAADLLAQAEHDPFAAVALLTPDRRLAQDVAKEVSHQLASLATAETARDALRRFGMALVVSDLEEALRVAEELAPEHLQLVGDAAESLASRIHSAGAVFVGAASGEVFGDYIAGPSHVLPTCGTARFASALGVADFQRRSHRLRLSAEAASRRASATAILATAEGLPAHAAAARRRLL
jgi:histidinol dehydrogenase